MSENTSNPTADQSGNGPSDDQETTAGQQQGQPQQQDKAVDDPSPTADR